MGEPNLPCRSLNRKIIWVIKGKQLTLKRRLYNKYEWNTKTGVFLRSFLSQFGEGKSELSPQSCWGAVFIKRDFLAPSVTAIQKEDLLEVRLSPSVT